MKSILYNLSFLFCLILFLGCIEDDKFGLSDLKEIKTFEIPGQASGTTINSEERSISISFNIGEDVSAKVPSVIEISNMATISPTVEEAQGFSEPVLYTVMAEDGSEAVWTVIAEVAEAQPQIENSNFNDWYDAGGYQQPGISADETVWDTPNKGLTIISDPNTTPEDLGNGDFAAKLVSTKAPFLVRMAAGAFYTGSFTDGALNPVDPAANVNLGIVFTARPQAFKVDYTYAPGDEYLDADGNPLPGSDEMDIYLLLDKREGNQITRIGTGWYRSGDTVADWTTLEVNIKYGALSASDPEFEYANIKEGEIWGNADDTPTHITVVFTSSALGDFFTGAIGSELRINNFELIY
ncbi:PCMD domain-containing protein [Flagellimonas zhangzhouensis]|uniref:Putative carbohydrate metabolism domain-containing protein n=1 Tax=Flagellimonas zhangzhouensis TaxID=1073328 RepID=A0A1H2S6R0_9FLAO|nr:PCMD domain-containing protein [Allomuricauda zhangzhouensis]SDQ71339.1 Putative carbohydrate metabolism domain-containing protein [Allomuricauda zhangzhouensis]SDW27293.1 Putative carbohydrate metabolism domain-containing protein [Allomuricauda zhangzhouensis]